MKNHPVAKVCYGLFVGLSFIMLSGADVIFNVLDHYPESILKLSGNVSQDIVDLIHQMLSKEPDYWPESAEVVLKKIEKIEKNRDTVKAKFKRFVVKPLSDNL